MKIIYKIEDILKNEGEIKNSLFFIFAINTYFLIEENDYSIYHIDGKLKSDDDNEVIHLLDKRIIIPINDDFISLLNQSTHFYIELIDDNYEFYFLNKKTKKVFSVTETSLISDIKNKINKETFIFLQNLF